MALTIEEVARMPLTDQKIMTVHKLTGDGDDTAVPVVKLKMSKVEAAWTANIDADIWKQVHSGTNDYADGYVTTINVGDPAIEDDGIQSTKKHLLFCIGY